MPSKIEWTDETWNPIIGCSKISTGCENCYAEKMAERIASIACSKHLVFSPSWMSDTDRAYTDVVKLWHDPKSEKTYWKGWNGKTAFFESALEKPLHWKKPRKIFVCSMGDLFHESVPLKWVARIMKTVKLSPQHIFMFLTKRHKRMAAFFSRYYFPWNEDALPNLWLGVTAENQAMADWRIPTLLQIRAAKRFVSVEPMLGAINIADDCYSSYDRAALNSQMTGCERQDNKINWVICGCESGKNRRPMKLEWARSLRDQCKGADVPFFMKQMEINGKVCKDINQFPIDLRIREYPKKAGE